MIIHKFITRDLEFEINMTSQALISKIRPIRNDIVSSIYNIKQKEIEQTWHNIICLKTRVLTIINSVVSSLLGVVRLCISLS